MEEVLDYIVKKRMTYKLADGANGKEAILMICPWCLDTKYHFYLNLKHKVFHCHKCNNSGTFLTFKAKHGDVAAILPIGPSIEPEEVNPDKEKIAEAHASLVFDKEASLYVASRLFSKEAVEYFRLGMSEEDGVKWLWMPYIDISGAVRNVKKRSINKAEREFKRWTGRDSILFNEQALAIQSPSIIICEGETDTVSLWSLGVKNVVGVPTGAKGINPNWVQQLDKYQQIYIAYDNDAAGNDGANSLGQRLGFERCYRITLPSEIKDINEYVKHGHTLDDMQRLITEAKLLDVQYVTSIYDGFGKFLRTHWTNKVEDTLPVPWIGLQKLTDGFVPGDLIIVASRPGVGKSSFALNILYKYSKIRIPTLLISMEMGLQRILPRIAAMEEKIDSKEVATFELIQKVRDKFKDVPFYVADICRKVNFDFIADTMRMSVRRYGIKFAVFDNLHFLVRSSNDQVREVSLISNNFKLLAGELNIPILVIARPRKTQDKIISNIDLKDSADIEADADIVILLHRDPKVDPKVLGKSSSYNMTEGIYDPRCLVRISKARYAAGGDMYLNFADDICTITEIPES